MLTGILNCVFSVPEAHTFFLSRFDEDRPKFDQHRMVSLEVTRTFSFSFVVSYTRTYTAINRGEETTHCDDRCW